jgi:hypothetical protein
MTLSVRLLALMLALACTPALLAQSWGRVAVIPAAPTTTTPVTLAWVSWCTREYQFNVEKRDGAIHLDVIGDGLCGDPPITHTWYVPIGTLEAGSYRLTHSMSGNPAVYESGFIHVRNAAPGPFEIHPGAVRTNPSGLRMRIERRDEWGTPESLCWDPQCSNVVIRVGGVVATNVRPALDGSAWFDAPPHAAGLVDVRVERKDAAALVYPAAVLYFDSPDAGGFERILFPVLFSAKGANGSDWRSEAVVSNPNEWFVENYNTIDSLVCVTFPCGERLSPGSYARLTGPSFTRGAVLLVPRAEADNLSFALRIRDVSREAEGFGTEVPVVRESAMMANRPATLLDVPLDPRYRVKLRIYGYDEWPSDTPDASVEIIDPLTRERKGRHYVRMTLLDTHRYGELDLPAGAEGERVAIYVYAPQDMPVWAFASVTNNTTQQVTLVTPAGGKSSPCNPCEVR